MPLPQQPSTQSTVCHTGLSQCGIVCQDGTPDWVHLAQSDACSAFVVCCTVCCCWQGVVVAEGAFRTFKPFNHTGYAATRRRLGLLTYC